MVPQTLFKAGCLIELIAPVASPKQILNIESDIGSAQTGFCYTTIAHTIVLAANKKWLEMANASRFVSCVLTSAEVGRIASGTLQKPTLIYENAPEAFHHLHNLAIHQKSYESSAEEVKQQIAPSARVHDTAVIEGRVTIGENASIGAHCVITGPVQIGADTNIHEHCTIGTEGLFSKTIGGMLHHVRHHGGVVLGKRCQIHAGVNVSRSVHFGCSTTVEDEVSMGIHANVGHDSFVGRGATLSTKVALLGRVRIGARCWVGAGAMVSNGVVVGEESQIRLGSVVLQDLDPHSDVSGNFARPHQQMLREFLR